MSTIFRPYRASSAERSDRSAGDRLRHRQKVREAIRENIADVIAEEAIIGQSKNRIVKVPLRGVKEYRFIYGDNAPGVAQGSGDTQPGQLLKRGKAQQPAPGDEAGDQPGQDYYETDITLEELVAIMFEDLELPELERKAMRQLASESSKRQGYQPVGVRVRLDKRRTVRAKLKREIASNKRSPERDDARLPFRKEDLNFKRTVMDPRLESNAVVICIMDTSGSMDTLKKYLARSFFFLLHAFVATKYQHVEVVFIAHHTEAREVTEEEFFHKGESGGTFVSSGYERALEVIHARYHPALWNVYAFHCSDGDNFVSDNEAALRGAQALCEICNLFGYGEIKPRGLHRYDNSLLSVFRQLTADNYQTVVIENKADIWPSFKALLGKDRAQAG